MKVSTDVPAHSVDGNPGVLEGHGRLEDEQVVVPGVVEVDGALSFHGDMVSGSVVGV